MTASGPGRGTGPPFPAAEGGGHGAGGIERRFPAAEDGEAGAEGGDAGAEGGVAGAEGASLSSGRRAWGPLFVLVDFTRIIVVFPPRVGRIPRPCRVVRDYCRQDAKDGETVHACRVVMNAVARLPGYGDRFARSSMPFL